ncbi:MAG: type II secretion system protein, partial [Patescibacteria group bacterium]
MSKKRNSGFTLLEVLVVLGILSVFLLAAITISIVSVRNLKSSENKLLGTRYAEGLMEWVRGEKDADWDVFITKQGLWCFNEEEIIWPITTGNCAGQEKIKQIFDREVTLTYDDLSERVVVNVKVFWNEGNEIV